MTLPDVLLLPLYLLALLVPAVGVVLTVNAVRRPRINALTFAAIFVDAVGVLILTYLFAVANAAAEFPFPREIGQIVFRGVLIVLGLVCVWFFRLYRSGGFRDA